MLYTKELAEELKKAIGNIEMKAEDEGNTFKVVATTQDVDRDGEQIKVNWWDTENYFKNPVILANHRYVVENIVGKGTAFYKSKWVMVLEWVFSKTNPLAILINNLYNEGMLKAVSVGFIPKRRNQQDPSIVEEAELLETSFVAIGCNPNAISLDKKLYDEAVAKGIIKEIKEEEKEVVETPKEEEKEVVKEYTIKDVMEAISWIKSDINELKAKSVTDDNVDEEAKKLLEKKEIVQSIVRGLNNGLSNFKKLEKL